MILKGNILRRFLLTLLVLGCLGTALVAGGLHQLDAWSRAPHAMPTPQVVQLRKGMTLRQLSETLENQKVIDHWPLFYTWVRVNSLFARFQAGPYRFELFARPVDIATDMTTGKVYQPVLVQFTIPEGFSLRKITDRLVANGIGKKEDVWRLLHNRDFIASLKIEASSLEGYLYPATYQFTEFPDPNKAIQKMVQTFWENLPPGYQEAISARKLTLHQAVTFGSLIEMETLHPDEKPYVSEVIWRRLNDKVPLAIDAAIIYGIADYDGNIRRRHLEDAKNPYNTRIHRGLPPSPIGSVSRESLAAVLTPSNMGYYYYVLELGPDQRHHFSRTLTEHNEYVKKLVRGIQENQKTGRQANQLMKSN